MQEEEKIKNSIQFHSPITDRSNEIELSKGIKFQVNTENSFLNNSHSKYILRQQTNKDDNSPIILKDKSELTESKPKKRGPIELKMTFSNLMCIQKHKVEPKLTLPVIQNTFSSPSPSPPQKKPYKILSTSPDITSSNKQIKTEPNYNIINKEKASTLTSSSTSKQTNPSNYNKSVTFLNYSPIIKKTKKSIGMASACPIAPLLQEYPNFKKNTHSFFSSGYVKVYGVNSYKGISHNYNEDKVSIVANIPKPKYYIGEWPSNLSIFSLFDGHGGKTCSNFLSENFHIYLTKNRNFPKDIERALKETFSKLENEFLTTIAISQENELVDKSGSCALVIVVADDICYIANLGDSRAIISNNHGKEVIQLTVDHKPNLKKEKNRIEQNEGEVYKAHQYRNIYRIFPGNLSVSRTIGDAGSKIPSFGGKIGCVSPIPEISKFKIVPEVNDFIVIGCDGIYDKCTNEEIVHYIWNTLNYKETLGENEHHQAGICADMAIKLAMNKLSTDNVTSVFLGFENFESDFNKKKGVFTCKDNVDNGKKEVKNEELLTNLARNSTRNPDNKNHNINDYSNFKTATDTESHHHHHKHRHKKKTKLIQIECKDKYENSN